MMNTIGLDIDAPLYGSVEPKNAGVAVRKEPQELEEPEIPQRMPVFVKEPKAVKPVRKTAAAPAREPVPEETGEKPGKVTTKEAQESARQVAMEIAQGQAEGEKNAYCFPPIDLLRRPIGINADGTEEMRENSARLNETLASFRIDAHIINVTRGPSVTRYEVELDKGVRLSKLTSCADDIALSLGASGVRIAAVPGKISIVGIEVPNRTVTTVSLREVIDSPEFARAKGKSSFSVGKDIGGNCIVGNIAKMPHLLIAGTTGSGKSVCMNSIIISLLYKAGPEDVKLIMVDPKMVELGIYNGIPHLLIPVVTDPKKAAGSLQWAVTEMLRRYKLMSDAGVRDLESYNSIMESEEDGQKLPQVIVIIDELADLMLVAAKEVEDSICRIAQMGRASGMHLIIATQRPSADVITGLMKANIPSRIAFSVASAMESRIILDTQGAEKLVGKGDMLYAPIGCGKPLRVQGCFVTDSEVEAVAGYVKDHYVADYNQQVLEEIEKKAQQTGKNGKGSAPEAEPNDEELEGDEMLPAAVDVILETGQASVSMLQRRLKLGYARAARIVDEMEEKGIVGPFQGSKPRAILITKEEWAARNGTMTEELPFDPEVPDELL
ncbi:MAG: DNA translocase FtsK [Oscillospiraceae bacterium]|nr:DNA translocase FtsK [Oscillospiraceae bacterium]